MSKTFITETELKNFKEKALGLAKEIAINNNIITDFGADIPKGNDLNWRYFAKEILNIKINTLTHTEIWTQRTMDTQYVDYSDDLFNKAIEVIDTIDYYNRHNIVKKEYPLLAKFNFAISITLRNTIVNHKYEK